MCKKVKGQSSHFTITLNTINYLVKYSVTANVMKCWDILQNAWHYFAWGLYAAGLFNFWNGCRLCFQLDMVNRWGWVGVSCIITWYIGKHSIEMDERGNFFQHWHVPNVLPENMQRHWPCLTGDQCPILCIAPTFVILKMTCQYVISFIFCWKNLLTFGYLEDDMQLLSTKSFIFFSFPDCWNLTCSYSLLSC